MDSKQFATNNGALIHAPSRPLAPRFAMGLPPSAALFQAESVGVAEVAGPRQRATSPWFDVARIRRGVVRCADIDCPAWREKGAMVVMIDGAAFSLPRSNLAATASRRR